MRIWDISMTVDSQMQVYKNRVEKKPVFTVSRDFTTGSVYESRMALDLHTGTHLDAPLHILKNGETIDQADLGKLITPCRVLDLTGVADSISDHDLMKYQIKQGDFILFKTHNSFTDDFDERFVFLDESAARYLKETQIKGVGIDALGIERDQAVHPTHKLLMSSDIMILEGLRLSQIKAGDYILIALPLKLSGVEASPVRAVLIDQFPSISG